MQAQARQVRHSPAHLHPLPPHRCIISGSAEAQRTNGQALHFAGCASCGRAGQQLDYSVA